jgi:uncharacterized protein
MAKMFTVDSDGHILEPLDLWERYLEPRYRDRAIRRRLNEKGYEYLEFDREPMFLPAGTMGGWGGAYMDIKELMIPGKLTYWESAQRTPGAIDPDARVREMDEQGIDVAILYPTVGLAWESQVTDPEICAAYCRAYNNYLFDFCSAHPDRLIPIAHVNLRDVNLAVAEVERVKGRAKGIFITPYPTTGCPHGDRYYDPFWGACEAAGLPVSSHVQTRPGTPGAELHGSTTPPELKVWFEMSVWFQFMQLPFDSLLGLNCVFQGGVLSRFPKLRYVVLETGCGWLPGWLDRADGKYELFGFTTGLTQSPGKLFRDRCWISVDVDESSIPIVARILGANRMMWATDYPHIDAHKDPVGELHRHIAELAPAEQEWILGKAAAELYRL